MSTLPATAHWADPAWRQVLAEQLDDSLLRLRLLLRRRIAWLRHQSGHDPLEGYRGVVVSDARADAALAGPDRAAEAAYHAGDRGAVNLGRSIEAVETQLSERAAAMTAAGTPFPADHLAQILPLSRFDHDVLVLALAPELDPRFERLYAYANDDATRRHATADLARALFRGPARTPPDPLRPDRAMLRMGLLRPPAPAGAGTAAAALWLEPRVAWYLQAVDHPGLPGGLRLRPVPPAPLPAELDQAVAAVARALRNRTPTTAGLPVVNLVGDSKGRAAALACTIAAALGRTVLVPTVAAGTEPRSVVPHLEREATLRGAAYLFDGLDESRDADELVELVDQLQAPVMVTSAYPLRCDRPVVAVTVPPSRAATHRALWEQALPDLVDDGERSLDEIAHHFRLDPDGVGRVAALSRGAARLRGGPVRTGHVWDECRRYGRRRLGGLAERIEASHGWDDIVLPPDVRRQLEEIAAQVRHRTLVYERWGFGPRLARGRGVTALFAGPSGTGKTMAAEILAAELGLDLYRIDLAGVVNKYIGETEKNLRRLFDAAEESGAVLFFDEADALFGRRTEVRDSHDRYANIEVDYLLQRMETYTGLAVLATNRKGALDRAFLRRLRFLVDFPFPAADYRLRIWQKALPSSAPQSGVDFGVLARLELAGGSIQSIAVNAAFLAAATSPSVTMGHLMHAAAREYAKLDKAPTESEFGGFPRAVAR